MNVHRLQERARARVFELAALKSQLTEQSMKCEAFCWIVPAIRLHVSSRNHFLRIDYIELNQEKNQMHHGNGNGNRTTGCYMN